VTRRHGARLDASDKQWHLTSPTPYDPPLTYGGWLQSRSLGTRIANILRKRETDDDETNGKDEHSDHHERRRRHRVVIHTSPFLRCVQTSIAISAGLAQNPGHGHHHTRSAPSASSAKSASSFYGSPRIRPTITTDLSRHHTAQERQRSPRRAHDKSEDKDGHSQIRKSTLRVDAFLGEWLTPDYFEQIMPPPESIMMVAAAKADLLRREDYSTLINHIHHPTTGQRPVIQGFPGGWGSPTVSAVGSEADEGGLGSLATLGQGLPLAVTRRDRTSSLSSAGSSGSGSHAHAHVVPKALPPTTLKTSQRGVYQPPIPHYAISNSEPIPTGYVAHARDACVSVDYAWDSMREPLNFGSGGEYGEEWSGMHKRFRRGLGSLIDYYRDEGNTTALRSLGSSASLRSIGSASASASASAAAVPTSHTKPAPLSQSEKEKPTDEGEVDESDIDLVLILVTHGAGCNALIGALTNQPVLLDVGMASLTMAVRKPTPRNTPLTSPSTSPRHSRHPSRSTPMHLSEEYEVKLMANTEHLRTPSNAGTPTGSRAPSAGFGAPFVSPNSSFTNMRIVNGFVEPDHRSRSAGTGLNSAFGSMRRTTSASTPVPMSKSYAQVRTSFGLWSAPTKPSLSVSPERPDDSPQEEDEDEEGDGPGDDMVLNFGPSSIASGDGAGDARSVAASKRSSRQSTLSASQKTPAVADDGEDEGDDVSPLGGLWGSGSVPKSEGSPVFKRRWTVNAETQPGVGG
jgi:hypothetical protein